MEFVSFPCFLEEAVEWPLILFVEADKEESREVGKERAYTLLDPASVILWSFDPIFDPIFDSIFNGTMLLCSVVICLCSATIGLIETPAIVPQQRLLFATRLVSNNMTMTIINEVAVTDKGNSLTSSKIRAEQRSGCLLQYFQTHTPTTTRRMQNFNAIWDINCSTERVTRNWIHRNNFSTTTIANWPNRTRITQKQSEDAPRREQPHT